MLFLRKLCFDDWKKNVYIKIARVFGSSFDSIFIFGILFNLLLYTRKYSLYSLSLSVSLSLYIIPLDTDGVSK